MVAMNNDNPMIEAIIETFRQAGKEITVTQARLVFESLDNDSIEVNQEVWQLLEDAMGLPAPLRPGDPRLN